MDQRSSIRSYHERRLEHLKTMRTPWDEVYREIDKWLVPGYVRLNPVENHSDKGNRRMLNLVDYRGLKAHRVFRSGMQSGMTSKARPWCKLTTRDEKLRDNHDVKVYLDEATTRIREVMDKSNIYETFHHKYGALGAVGTAVSYLSPDPTYIVRNNHLTAGHYWIADNHLGMVDTLYHIIPMTAQQIVGHFSRPMDMIPRQVQDAYDRGDRDKQYLVYHAMEPRTHRDESMADDPMHMPWLSNYWMREDEDKGRMMRESGSKINRVIASRWNAYPEDPYGYSLGMDALADIKQLQHTQSRRLEILDKISRPPMSAPSALKNKRASILPGSITYNDAIHASGGYRPAIDLSHYDLRPLREDIAALHVDIDEMFYNDLFLAVSNMEGVQPRTVFEIAERKEERLLQLGPALERVQNEELQPTVKGIYHYMAQAGMLPPAPEGHENINQEMGIEYTSIMAQAQQAVGALPLERLLEFVGKIAEATPDALDKVDTDIVISEYARRIGTPAAALVPKDEVDAIRKQRMQEQQAAQMAATAKDGAQAAQAGAGAVGELANIDDAMGGDPTRLLDEAGLAGYEPPAGYGSPTGA